MVLFILAYKSSISNSPFHFTRHTFGDFGLLLHVGVQRLLQGFQHGERFRSVNCFERIIKNLSFVECDSDVYFLFIILSKMAQR